MKTTHDLTVRETAEMYQVHPNTVYRYLEHDRRLVEAGKPAQYFPNAWRLPGNEKRAEYRIPEEDVEAFKRSRSEHKTHDRKKARQLLAKLAA